MKILKWTQRETKTFRRRLLDWFNANQRDLPWRKTRDPYCIWLSEIMLQQTRVAAVVPYYENFLKKFPDVQSLARARIDAVLKQWSGLGYYSRATNLQRTAKEIVARHGGEFPRKHESALSLPGVGQYTAAAVLSIAYGEPFAVLDGNVARVLARLGAVRGDLRAPKRWQQLGITAQNLLARNAAGAWNQAMMELGATVCTPKSPKCEKCPVAGFCRAHKLGIAGQLPSARVKPATVQITLAAAVLLDATGRTLLVRHTNASSPESNSGALFSRMWQFPAVEATADAAAALARHLRKDFGVVVSGNLQRKMTPLRTARHAVTFRAISLKPFLVRVGKLPEIAEARTPTLERLNGLPISNAARKIADIAIAYLD